MNTRQEPGNRLTFLGRGLSRASANNSECASTNPKHNGSEARRSVVRGRIAGSAGRRSYRTAQRMRAGVMWGALSRLCTVQETCWAAEPPGTSGSPKYRIVEAWGSVYACRGILALLDLDPSGKEAPRRFSLLRRRAVPWVCWLSLLRFLGGTSGRMSVEDSRVDVGFGTQPEGEAERFPRLDPDPPPFHSTSFHVMPAGTWTDNVHGLEARAFPVLRQTRLEPAIGPRALAHASRALRVPCCPQVQSSHG